MSKRILIFDANKCDDCPCLILYDDGAVWCRKSNRKLYSDDIHGRIPDWCELKEVPDDTSEEDYLRNRQISTNSCSGTLEDILEDVFSNPIPYNGDNIGARS